MKKLKFKSLGDTPLEDVHLAFNDAFSDYEVQIVMPLENLREMMLARDLKPEYSMGCFDGNRLIGFILTGIREIDGKKYAYDGGTGVVKDFRRKGIGEKLLQKLIQLLKDRNFDYFILEVLENNTPAIQLYSKYGFKKKRRLECFELNKLNISDTIPNGFLFTCDISILIQLSTPDYLLFEPTWQNSFTSIQNVISNYKFSAIVQNNHILAYGFIHKKKGDIPQIGISKEWKNKNLEKLLIKNLVQFTESENIIFLNVEDNNYLREKLLEIGFTNKINQFEMIFKF